MHLQFNVSGEAASRLATRARQSSPAMVAKADLLDYWRLLAEATPAVSPAEGRLLMDALNGTYLGVDMAQLVWASVADACDDGQLGAKWDVDCAALVERLRALDRLSAVALVAAVGEAWDCVSAGQDIDDALRAAGLTESA